MQSEPTMEKLQPDKHEIRQGHMQAVPWENEKAMTFQQELEHLVNRYCQENGSNTPDFILAEYLMRCLDTFDQAVNAREGWYGREVKRLPKPGEIVNYPVPKIGDPGMPPQD
jgi:hypothetical protein